MKRVLLLFVGVLTLALAVPVAASARSSHHRHSHKTHKTHKSHKSRHVTARVVQVGSPTPVTPGTTPGPSNDASAGTIASFTGGVLTLTLTDGSSLSGKVTVDTKIECEAAATTPTATTADDHGSGDDDHGDRNSVGDGNGGGDGNQGDDDGAAGQPTCDAAALVAGTVVREAQLRIGSTGAIFKHVNLVK